MLKMKKYMDGIILMVNGTLYYQKEAMLRDGIKIFHLISGIC